MATAQAPAATTARLRNSSAAGCAGGATQSTAAAPSNEAVRKNCQGWSADFAGTFAGAEAGTGAGSVEVVEFIVETRLQRGVGCRSAGRRLRRRLRPRAPVQRKDANDNGRANAEQIRKEPRQAIEAFVERLGQRFLRSVLGHE